MDNKVSQSEFQTGSDNNHRKLKRIAIILAVTLIPLSLIINFVPTFMARYLIESQLEKLGIEHGGIDTVRVNIFKREVWAGPLHIRMSDSDPGQLGELGIKIRFLPIFKKRAMVESVLIRGIDIFVSRNPDHKITLNGIPLNQFFPKDEETKTKNAEGEPWGIGLIKFELLESRVIFREKTGGILTVEIDKFSLSNFHSWYPDKAGFFDLKAKVNDIKLNWTGEARPFSNNITLAIDAQTNEVTLPNIIRFVGPIGFKRKDGLYNSHLKLNITIFDSGRLEGLTEGTLEVIGLNYEREGDFSLTVDQAEINLNTEYTLSENSDFHLGGSILTKAEKIKGVVSKQNKFGVDGVVIELKDLNLTLGADKAFQVSSKTQTTLENAEYSGTIQVSVATLLDVLKYIQSLSSRKKAALEQKQLGYKLDGKISTPRSDIKVKKIISNSLFDLKSAGGDVSIETAGSIEGSEINYSVSKRTTTIESLRIELESLNIRTSEDEVSIDLMGNTHANDYQIKGTIGQARVEKIESVIKECRVNIQPGEIAVEVSISALLNGNKFSTNKRKDVTQTNVTASEIMITNKGSIVVSEQEMSWQSDLDFKVDGLDVSLDKGTMANVKLSMLELKGAQVNQNQEFKTESLSVSGLDIFITRQFVEKALKIRSDKSKKDNESTHHNDKESHSSLVKKIQKRLKEKGYYKGSIDGQMGPQTEAAINTYREISGLPLAVVGLRKTLSALTDTPGPPIALSFGLFALVDGANIRFQDNTVQPAVDIETFFQIAEIQGFDSSDPAKRAKVRIVADINEFTHLELDGSFGGVGPESNFDVSGKIENIELHTYSPYTTEFGGFMLESGQLTTLSDTISKEGNLDGLLNVELEGLEVTPLTEQDQDRLSGRVGLPVETLVGLLEDSEGRISLELPVGGTISKPAIDIKPAIHKAIGGILKKVFPPTLVASILISGDQGDLSFTPIKFSPGSKKLDREAKTYADNILLLLEEQPKLSLDFCGRSTYEDLAKKAGLPFKSPITSEKQDTGTKNSEGEHSTKLIRILKKYEPKMNVLAVDRTSAVRSYLIKEKGADPKRITECRPYFDVNDPGPPRVEISF
jgi:peptidoglycan hydrolase-like protein with peptidoglycan-binding domain